MERGDIGELWERKSTVMVVGKRMPKLDIWEGLCSYVTVKTKPFISELTASPYPSPQHIHHHNTPQRSWKLISILTMSLFTSITRSLHKALTKICTPLILKFFLQYFFCIPWNFWSASVKWSISSTFSQKFPSSSKHFSTRGTTDIWVRIAPCVDIQYHCIFSIWWPL